MPSTKPKRVRVERGLYKRGKTYHACATPEGSKTAVWKSLGEVNLSHARRLRDEFVGEVRGGKVVGGRTRFTKVAGAWLDEQRSLLAAGQIRPNTFAQYESGLRLYVLPHFASRMVQTIKPDDLVQWHRSLKSRGISDGSIANHWKPLRMTLGYAVRHGYAGSNPADALERRERPKPGPKRVRYLEADQIDALLKASHERYRLALELAIFCGPRLSELRGLRWQDVSLAEGIVRITG